MRFPHEILEEILKLSSQFDGSSLEHERGRLQTLATFRLVDREWNGVATPLFFHSIYLGKSGGKAVQFLRTLMEPPALGRIVRTLEISEGIDGQKGDEFLVIILGLCPNLVELWIKNFEIDVAVLLSATPQIRYLRLDAGTLPDKLKSPASEGPKNLQILVLHDTEHEMIDSEQSYWTLNYPAPLPLLGMGMLSLRGDSIWSNSMSVIALKNSLPSVKYLDWTDRVSTSWNDDGNSELNECTAITHLQAPVSSCRDLGFTSRNEESILLHLRNCRLKTLHLLELSSIEELVNILDENCPALSKLSTFLYSPSSALKSKEKTLLKEEVELECEKRNINFGGICSGGLNEFGRLVYPESKLM